MKNKIKYALFFLLFLANTSFAQPPSLEHPIVVLTTSYNSKAGLKKCIESIFSQKYTNYRVIYIDDHSTDGTAKQVKTLVKRLYRKKKLEFRYFRNNKRKKFLENIYNGVHYCKDNEIVVSLGADDWFTDDQVLKKINEAYSKKEVWLTHGTSIELPTNTSARHLLAYEPVEVSDESTRSSAFRGYSTPTPLTTFYAWLFKRIHKEDLRCEGKFLEAAEEQAFLFPMMEMAGDRQAFISDITYGSNGTNVSSSAKERSMQQSQCQQYLRSKAPYPRLP